MIKQKTEKNEKSDKNVKLQKTKFGEKSSVLAGSACIMKKYTI
jgi:hypothetical protein